MHVLHCCNYFSSFKLFRIWQYISGWPQTHGHLPSSSTMLIYNITPNCFISLKKLYKVECFFKYQDMSDFLLLYRKQYIYMHTYTYTLIYNDWLLIYIGYLLVVYWKSGTFSSPLKTCKQWYFLQFPFATSFVNETRLII